MLVFTNEWKILLNIFIKANFFYLETPTLKTNMIQWSYAANAGRKKKLNSSRFSPRQLAAEKIPAQFAAKNYPFSEKN